MSNRKLIRTTLADVKARRDEGFQQRDRSNGGPQQRGGMPPPRPSQSSSSSSSIQIRKRQPPPTETHAEIYYYKKQIDAHTQMVLVLLDGEEIELEDQSPVGSESFDPEAQYQIHVQGRRPRLGARRSRTRG